MASESFGAMLRRLREATPGYSNGNGATPPHPWLSQNGLARRSGIDPAYVNHLEAGLKPPPARLVVEALARTLRLDDADACRLLVSAGYWPWPGDPERTERAILAAERALGGAS